MQRTELTHAAHNYMESERTGLLTTSVKETTCASVEEPQTYKTGKYPSPLHILTVR